MKSSLALALATTIMAAFSGRGAERAPVAARVGVSPLDQAERILASRYAHGRITAEEYERMTALLRR